MKIRTGFVSNSSSSSYIVRIFDTYQNFVENVNNDEVVYSNYVSDTIDRCKNIIKKYNETGPTSTDDKLSAWTYESNRRLIDAYNSFKESNDVIKFIKDVNWVQVEDCGDNVRIVGSTAMHNSYDDVPPFINHMIAYYMCEHPSVKIIMERVSD